MNSHRAIALLGLASSVLAATAIVVSCVGDDATTTPSGDAAASADASGDGANPVDGATLDAGDAAEAAAPVCDASPCVVQISAGGAHTCARILDGTVRCWGNNAFGESGGGVVSPPPDGGFDEIVTPATYTTPHIVPGFPAATVIGAGGSYRSNGISCAATSDTKMYCWGIDKSQQLGRGGTAKVGDVTNPVPARSAFKCSAVGSRNSSFRSCSSKETTARRVANSKRSREAQSAST